MAELTPLFLLLLLFPLSGSQSAEQEAGGPPPRPHIRDFLRKEETGHLNSKKTYAHVDKDNAKVGLFIAAAMGTFALMAAVYCIYNKFYIKHQYLHTQLSDHPDLTSDPTEPPPVFFQASVGPSLMEARRGGYGSLSDSPSVISVGPSLMEVRRGGYGSLSDSPSVISVPPSLMEVRGGGYGSLSDSPSVISVGPSLMEVRRGGYGSLSDSPSVISVPPSLSPPPSAIAMPFPPRLLSSRSLRTISARDLERSCI